MAVSVASQEQEPASMLGDIANTHFFWCDSNELNRETGELIRSHDEWKFREEIAEFVGRFENQIETFVSDNNLLIKVNKWPRESDFPTAHLIKMVGWSGTYEDIPGITKENAQVEVVVDHIMDSSELRELEFLRVAKERKFLIACSKHKDMQDVHHAFEFHFAPELKDAVWNLYQWPSTVPHAVLCLKIFGFRFSKSISEVLSIVVAAKTLLRQHRNNESILALFQYKRHEIGTCCAPFVARSFLPEQELIEAAANVIASKAKRWKDLPSRLEMAINPEKLASLGLAQLGLLSGPRAKAEPASDIRSRNDGTEFEGFIGILLTSHHIKVEYTPQTGDFGADLIATHGGNKCAIQCKDHAAPVGVKAIQEVYAARQFYDCQLAACISRNGFTNQAVSLALSLGVLLYTLAELGQGDLFVRMKADPISQQL